MHYIYAQVNLQRTINKISLRGVSVENRRHKAAGIVGDWSREAGVAALSGCTLCMLYLSGQHYKTAAFTPGQLHWSGIGLLSDSTG